MSSSDHGGAPALQYLAENKPDLLAQRVGQAMHFATEYAKAVLSTIPLPEPFPEREMQMAIVQSVLAALDQPAFADLHVRYRRALAWATRPEVRPEIGFMLGAGIVSRPPTPENVQALRRLSETPEYAAFEGRYPATMLEIFYAQIPTDRALLAP